MIRLSSPRAFLVFLALFVTLNLLTTSVHGFSFHDVPLVEPCNCSSGLEKWKVCRLLNPVCWKSVLDTCDSCTSSSGCSSEERCISGSCIVEVGDGNESCRDRISDSTPPANECSTCSGSGDCSGECIDGVCMTEYESEKYVCLGVQSR